MRRVRVFICFMLMTLMALSAQMPAYAATAAKSVKLDRAKASITLGNKLTLKATVSPSKASQAVTWSSGNSAVVAVSKKGVITAFKMGSAKITATTGNGKKASCVVTVKAKPDSMYADPGVLALKAGTKKAIVMKVSPSSSLVPGNLKYKSSRTSVASVNAKGVVTAKKAGQTLITISSSDRARYGDSLSCKLICYVFKAEPKPAKITSQDLTLTIGTKKLKMPMTENQVCAALPGGELYTSEYGDDWYYSYTVGGRAVLFTFNAKGQFMSVLVQDKRTSTSRGIKTGAALNQVTAKYGYPKHGEWMDNGSYIYYPVRVGRKTYHLSFDITASSRRVSMITIADASIGHSVG